MLAVFRRNPSPGIPANPEPAGAQVKKNLFHAVAAFLGFTLLFATPLSAQQLATLNVTVNDPSGSVISQARVTLRNLETDGKRTDFSSVTGVAIVPGLPAGKYQLTVESSRQGGIRRNRKSVRLADCEKPANLQSLAGLH
jgi:hypothetical protein